MPTITTEDGRTFYTPEPIRQDLAIPLHATNETCPTCGRRTGWDGHGYSDCKPVARDIWSDDPDRTTRNNDTRTSEQVTAKAFPAAQGHGYIFNDDGREVWASCTCGWEEIGARHGERRWRECATASAWDIHCENVGAR